MRWAAAVLWLGCACGRLGFNAAAGEFDGAPAEADGAPSAPDADMQRTARTIWMPPMPSEPEALDVLNSSSGDFDAYLTPDYLTLYFVSRRSGSVALHRADRSSRAEPFGDPELYLSDPDGETTRIEFLVEGLVGIASSDRGTGTGADLWAIQRTSEEDPFTFELLSISGPDLDADPHLTRGGLEVWWAPAGRPEGVGGQDLFRAERSSLEADFGAPELVSILSSSVADANATLSEDGTVVVYASYRSGSRGGLNLWYAVREDPDATFSAPQPVPAVNTELDEGEPFLSPDGCELFYSGDNQSSWNLYRVVLDAACVEGS